MKDIKRQNLILHHQDGTSLSIQLREYQRGDEEGMIACIREEYGETYFKRNFYDAQYLRQVAVCGHITFLVAQIQNGEIVGMMLLKRFDPQESMCEIASQIFKKKYRGYGLAEPFFVYGMEILKLHNYSAAYCLPVLFHDTTQRLLYRLGLRATGFVLNVFDMEQITHTYVKDRNKKHSQGIQILALGKRDAGILYLPEEHRNFGRNIYKRLGVTYHMADTEKISGNQNTHQEVKQERKVCRQQGCTPCSIVSYHNDIQNSLTIYIDRAEEDLQELLQQIHARYPLKGKQTANIFLNVSNPTAVKGYEIIRNLGYFFTGLKPLCSQREYMVLHHPGEVKTYFKDYAVSNEFAELLAYVQSSMQNKTDKTLNWKKVRLIP